MALKKQDYVDMGKYDSRAGKPLELLFRLKWQQEAYEAGWQAGEDEKAAAKAEEYEKAVSWKPPRKQQEAAPRRVARDIQRKMKSLVENLTRRAKFHADMGALRRAERRRDSFFSPNIRRAGATAD